MAMSSGHPSSCPLTVDAYASIVVLKSSGTPFAVMKGVSPPPTKGGQEINERNQSRPATLSSCCPRHHHPTLAERPFSGQASARAPRVASYARSRKQHWRILHGPLTSLLPSIFTKTRIKNSPLPSVKRNRNPLQGRREHSSGCQGRGIKAIKQKYRPTTTLKAKQAKSRRVGSPRYLIYTRRSPRVTSKGANTHSSSPNAHPNNEFENKPRWNFLGLQLFTQTIQRFTINSPLCKGMLIPPLLRVGPLSTQP